MGNGKPTYCLQDFRGKITEPSITPTELLSVSPEDILKKDFPWFSLRKNDLITCEEAYIHSFKFRKRGLKELNLELHYPTL